jgi:hypothetical protein
MSEYDEPGDWSAELTRLAGSVQPTPEAGLLVRSGIRRRQRRRAALAVAASAAVVAVVAGTTFALTRPSAVGPVPAAPTGTATTDADLFSCPQGPDLLQDPPPIPDLSEQQATIDSIKAESWDGFTIERTAPSPLGVVAMIDGDLARARSALGAVGVPIVYNWDPSLDSGGMGYLDWVMQWRLDPVVHEVAKIRFDIDGYAGIALWQDAGAVILQWKSPIPPEVQALDGVRPDRVTVIVRPTDYSSRELAHARGLVMKAFRSGAVNGRWTSVGSCADASGFVVGIHPPLSGERRAELQYLLSSIAGVPVMVIAQQPMMAA